jgi:16S rRNA processing protein RimM
MDEHLVMGKINGLFGVRGWVKVFSYTEPRDNILNYSPWYLDLKSGRQAVTLLQGASHGGGVIAQLDGYADRDLAATLMGCEISIPRLALPALAKDEYYWADLLGLAVVTQTGQRLGEVVDLMETGANDVLVVQGQNEHLIPFVRGIYVLEIDRAERRITVAWEPEV